jgi:hypothetical protein
MSGVTDHDGLLKAVESSFKRNSFEPGSDPQVNSPPVSGLKAGNVLAVEVVLKRQGMLSFSSLFVSDSGVPVRARAVGGVVGTGTRVCVLALDEEMKGALTFSGNGTASFNCGVASNSHSNSAILVSGNAKLTADPAQAYGDITIQGNASLTTSQPAQANAPRIPDPYGPQGRNLKVPAPSGELCKPAPSINAEGNSTILPGIYCGNFEIKKGTVTFAPGTYVINDGDLNIQAQATVRQATIDDGDGVTFILTGTTPADTGVLKISSGADIKLTAPSSGDYAGVLLFEDPDASYQNNGAIHSVLGGASLELNGAIYTPGREIGFLGGAESLGQCLQIVARKVTVTGGGTIKNDQSKCEALGTADMQQVRVRLIE